MNPFLCSTNRKLKSLYAIKIMPKHNPKPKKQAIRLEPHDSFKSAILRVNASGLYVYSYNKLVDVCIDLYGFSEEDSIEWVDYNIVGLEPNGLVVSQK